MQLLLLHLLFEYSYFKAMNIIAKLSFWIQAAKEKTSIITKLSFEDLILGALDQFRTEGYVEKIKNSITPESLPTNGADLHEFIYNQIAFT